MNNLFPLLHRARAELACPRCSNTGSIMKPLGLDECDLCHGERRNEATIELLEALVDHATGYIRKAMR